MTVFVNKSIFRLGITIFLETYLLKKGIEK